MGVSAVFSSSMALHATGPVIRMPPATTSQFTRTANVAAQATMHPREIVSPWTAAAALALPPVGEAVSLRHLESPDHPHQRARFITAPPRAMPCHTTDRQPSYKASPIAVCPAQYGS